MKKLTFLFLAAGILCSCQQVQRPVVQTDVPIFTTKEVIIKSKKRGKKRSKKRMVTESTLVTASGPAAKEWDLFDRADSVAKYNEMSLTDKKVLFETIIRVYRYLPSKNTFSSEAINTGIWKEVTDKGVNLSFGSDPTDWHPYLMYIHPLVISEMINFFLQAREENISTKELKQWQRALCKLINTEPDSQTAAAILVRKEELAKAGIIIKEEDGKISARRIWINWNKYRAEMN